MTEGILIRQAVTSCGSVFIAAFLLVAGFSMSSLFHCQRPKLPPGQVSAEKILGSFAKCRSGALPSCCGVKLCGSAVSVCVFQSELLLF